jgi:hypothetical protein
LQPSDNGRGETVVRPGRAAFAAIVTAGLLAGAQAEAPVTEEGVSKSRLVSILGREVTNREGDGGRVIDVLVDLDGRSGAVVVEFGGFMGIGSRKVAVEWNALRFVREGNRSLLVVDVSREQIRDAPEYKPSEPPTVLTRQKKPEN